MAHTRQVEYADVTELKSENYVRLINRSFNFEGPFLLKFDWGEVGTSKSRRAHFPKMHFFLNAGSHCIVINLPVVTKFQVKDV